MEDKPALVRLYSEIFSCRNPAVMATIALILQLILSGIVKRGRLGAIIVRNQIYHQVLSPGLIAEYLGLNKELSQRDENPRTVARNTEVLASGIQKNKVFISYAWDTDEHQGRVVWLANTLT